MTDKKLDAVLETVGALIGEIQTGNSIGRLLTELEERYIALSNPLPSDEELREILETTAVRGHENLDVKAMRRAYAHALRLEVVIEVGDVEDTNYTDQEWGVFISGFNRAISRMNSARAKLAKEMEARCVNKKTKY